MTSNSHQRGRLLLVCSMIAFGLVAAIICLQILWILMGRSPLTVWVNVLIAAAFGGGLVLRRAANGQPKAEKVPDAGMDGRSSDARNAADD